MDNLELAEKRNDKNKISDFKKFNISNNSRENSGNKRKNDKSNNIENQNSTSKINDLSKYKSLKEYDISTKKNESNSEGMGKINIDGLFNGLKGIENKEDKKNKKIVIQSIMSSSSTEMNKIKSRIFESMIIG